MTRRLLWAFLLVTLISAGLSAGLSSVAARQSFQSFASAQLRGPAMREQREAQVLGDLSRAHLLSGAISAGLAALLGVWLARRIAAPLHQLERESRRYAAGETDLHFPTSGNDEVARLGQTFAGVTRQLDERREREKALLADIAHELRAPLTVLKSSIEALEDGLYEPTPERYRQLGQEVEGLSVLVSDLRLLSLADAGALPLNLALQDLGALARGVVGRMEALAEAKGIRLTCQVAPAPVQADAARLEQVVRNLLDNALRHTPAGGKICVEVRVAGAWAELTVTDSGLGLPVGEESLIFERFYRTDRSRAREDGGTGLGLAIVRSLVALHGGEVSARCHAGGGAVFVLRFPCAHQVKDIPAKQ